MTSPAGYKAALLKLRIFSKNRPRGSVSVMLDRIGLLHSSNAFQYLQCFSQTFKKYTLNFVLNGWGETFSRIVRNKLEAQGDPF